MKKTTLFSLLFCFILTISAYAKPQLVNKLIGVKLGYTADQVKEVLGKSQGEDELLPGIVSLTYQRPGANRFGIIVTLNKKGKVAIITVSDPSYKANVQGICIGTDAKKVKNLFGEPDKTEEMLWDIVKWEYHKYNVQFGILNGKVDDIGVNDFNRSGNE